MRDILVKRSYTRCAGETNPRPFSEKPKLSIFLDQYSKVLYILFNCLPGWGLSKVIKTKGQTIYFLLLLEKNKKRSETSLPASFSAWFSKKNISIVIFYYLTKFWCLVVFNWWDNGQYVSCDSLLTRLWHQNFEINLIFLMKSFLYMIKMSRQKFKYLEKEKSF